MYVLVDTATAGVEKFETLGDIITWCVKGLSKKAEAKPEPTPLPVTVVPGSLGKPTHAVIHEKLKERDDPAERTAPPADTDSFKETFFPAMTNYTEILEIKEEHAFNEMELRARFQELNSKANLEHVPLTKELPVIQPIYEVFIKNYCSDDTVKNIRRTNFAMPAWHLFISFPNHFGLDPKISAKIPDTNISVWGKIRSRVREGKNGLGFGVDGDLVQLHPRTSKFYEFLTFAKHLQDLFEDSKFSYEDVEELAYVSYCAYLKKEVDANLIEKWIGVFLSKKVVSAESQSIKSSTLYEEFQKYIAAIITHGTGCTDVAMYLAKQLEAAISQKIFSKVLKVAFSMDCQRKSDGMYWQNMKFRSDITNEAAGVESEDRTKLTYSICPDDNGGGEHYAPVL